MQAWILDQAQDYQGALNAAENALQNGSDSDWTLGQKAQMLVKLDRVEEGIQVLEQAVEEGSPAAFRIGLRVLAGTLHVKSPDYPRMWEFCQRGMKASLPEAFACTGTFYYFGWLKPIDYPTAFKWWKVAADLGVPESMVDIGILYWEGRGTPHDKNQAIAYWLKGAHADDARGVEKLRAHLTPWEFYTRYTLPTFEKEIREGELGDDPMAVSARFAQITWAGPVGNWSITWGLPILLGVILIGLVLIDRKSTRLNSSHQ